MDRHIDRRRFLRLTTLAAPLAASGRVDAGQGPVFDTVDVVVVGAGMAGLHAAGILRRAGRRVLVLEARAEAGGRVRTIRAPLDEDLYGEAGAIRIPDLHRGVRSLADAHGLSLIPFDSGNGAAVVRAGGRTVRVPDGLAELAGTLDLDSAEAGLNVRALLLRYVDDLPAGLADPDLEPEAFARWREIDRVSWPDWLRSRGASAGAATLMTVGGDSRDLSALYVLRQFALLRDVRLYSKILGGMDQLPRRMADALAGLVRFNAPVVRVEQRRNQIRVDYRDTDRTRSVHADRAILAVPFSTLRRLDVRPRFSADKARAIAELPYFPATRFLLQMTSRFWHAEGLSGAARTDQPAEFWDASYEQPADRGLLAGTVGGALGRELADMTRPRAVAFGVNLAAEAFPSVRRTFDKGVVYRWAADPWARGAFAVFHPGQMSAMMPALAAPEGRVSFAGEHTSAWMGWMEGAIESGARAAREALADVSGGLG